MSLEMISRQIGVGLDINILSHCPVPVKTDVRQVDLALRLSDGTNETVRFPNVPVFYSCFSPNHPPVKNDYIIEHSHFPPVLDRGKSGYIVEFPTGKMAIYSISPSS